MRRQMQSRKDVAPYSRVWVDGGMPPLHKCFAAWLLYNISELRLSLRGGCVVALFTENTYLAAVATVISYFLNFSLFWEWTLQLSLKTSVRLQLSLLEVILQLNMMLTNYIFIIITVICVRNLFMIRSIILLHFSIVCACIIIYRIIFAAS